MFVAYFMIWGAASMKRSGDSNIEIFSKEWFIQLILITSGGIILINYC